VRDAVARVIANICTTHWASTHYHSTHNTRCLGKECCHNYTHASTHAQFNVVYSNEKNKWSTGNEVWSARASDAPRTSPGARSRYAEVPAESR
jgi:hypothetical protein